MRVVAATLIVLLVVAVTVLGGMCYVLSRDVAEYQDRANVEMEQVRQYSEALDRVLVENQELRDDNTRLREQLEMPPRDDE